jgi:hypothetical protein
MGRTLTYVYLFAIYFMFIFHVDAIDESQIHYSITPHSQGEAHDGAHEDVIGELKGFI